MIKRILVPTDGSEASRTGLLYAFRLALRHRAAVTGLHVVDIKLLEGPILRDVSASLGTAPFVNYQGNITALLEARGRSALEEMGAICAREGIPCETHLVTGIVSRTIAEYGELADLIVMGRSGEHSPWLEGLAGSTAQAVVRRASTPVLVTGADTPGGGPLVVGYDGSAHARKALRVGADTAREWGLPLHLLTAGPEADGLQKEARAYLQPHEDLDVAYVTRAGDAGEEMTAYAGECGAALVVMGAFGHSKLRHMVVGSTTAYMLNHAPCPLLLLH